MKHLNHARNALITVAVGLACVAAPAAGSVLFADNFDADESASILNFDRFINWQVVDGTVDYIRNGGYGLTCMDGGGCVDLDGSTSNGGRLVSKTAFTFAPGTTYRMSVTFSGNQRNSTSNDRIAWGLTDAVGDYFAAVSNIPASQPYATQWLEIAGVSGTRNLFVQDWNPGGDNIGVVLDNVLLETMPTIPEPASLALLGASLLGFAAQRRRFG